MIFASIHDVMAAEHAIQDGGLWCDMIPTPRQLSSDCGMAIELGSDDLDRALGIIAGRPIRLVSVFRPTRDGYTAVKAHEPPRTE